MDYLIIHNKEAIGKVVEPQADVSMGVVCGAFVPFPTYEGVQPVFRIFAEAVGTKLADSNQIGQVKLERYYQERDDLDLSVTTMTGLPVKTLWIHIVDFSKNLGDDGYEAEFCVAHEDGGFFLDASLWDRKGG